MILEREVVQNKQRIELSPNQNLVRDILEREVEKNILKTVSRSGGFAAEPEFLGDSLGGDRLLTLVENAAQAEIKKVSGPFLRHAEALFSTKVTPEFKTEREKDSSTHTTYTSIGNYMREQLRLGTDDATIGANTKAWLEYASNEALGANNDQARDMVTLANNTDLLIIVQRERMLQQAFTQRQASLRRTA